MNHNNPLAAVQTLRDVLAADLSCEAHHLADDGLALAEVPDLWNTCPLAAWFSSPVFSCEVGLIKPDPAIYRLACRRLGV